MHELTLAREIVTIVKAKLPNPDTKLKSITLEIGEMRQVIPDSLQFCYDTVTENTPLHGAKIVIIDIPLGGTCNQCAAIVEFSSTPFKCPQCGSEDLKLTRGFELSVKSIETD